MSRNGAEQLSSDAQYTFEWAALWPFLAAHMVPFAAIWTGVRTVDVIVCVALYWIRMFFITSGYHRYFAHRSYSMSRVLQFIVAFLGTTSAQKGVLWWAAHHRHHHSHSDLMGDVHSPKEGLFWSHIGWIMTTKHNDTRLDLIPDFATFPELLWLNKHFNYPPILLGVACFLVGGWSMLVTGFFLSTVILWHGTFTINSLSHIFGGRRYATTDTSRNNFTLAVITMGEGWHNNHHHYPASVKQGFYWWEIDVSYYILRVMSWVGLVWDLHKPPEHALTRNLLSGAASVELEASDKLAVDGTDG